MRSQRRITAPADSSSTSSRSRARDRCAAADAISFATDRSAAAARSRRRKGPERTQNYGTNLAGSLIKQRASFNLSFNGSTSYETPNLYAALPTGTRAEALAIRVPRDNFFMFGNFDYAITKDQTLRVSYNQNDSTQRNLGIGAYDLPEHGHTSEEHFHLSLIHI